MHVGRSKIVSGQGELGQAVFDEKSVRFMFGWTAREGSEMGEQKRVFDVPRMWLILGVAGLVIAVVLWLYAILTPGRQDSAVSVGSAFFSSGVVLLVGSHLVSLLKRQS